MNDVSAGILRIIDANLNRTGEGLRVLEEFARLSLNNTGITQRLKNLRHKLLHIDPALQKMLLHARGADEDVGSSMDVPGEMKSKDASEVIIANAKRVQESLRVLEELTKTHGIGLDSETFRQGRFELYTIEKELLGFFLHKEKVKRIKGLYVVVDSEWFKGRNPEDITRQAIDGGAEVIQLRYKTGSTRDFLTVAESLKVICSERDTPFIINDSLEVALACHADGLHIGQDDIPAKLARKMIPLDMILGVSARTLAEAKTAVAEGADYLGVGAVFATATKDSKAIGLRSLKEITEAVGVPVIAIGGINKENVKSVMDTGAVGAAVISAVLGAGNVREAARQLSVIIGEKKDG
jgi:thiamine-phosphate pyrophosphorylase